MTLDCHVHIMELAEDREGLARNMKKAGVDGGIIISLPPASFRHDGGKAPTRERLDNLFKWIEAPAELYPFYWIDPLEQDACDQVRQAVEMGVRGFKVICMHHYPGDPKALEVYRLIASLNKPILFHSGILYDGRESSKYNRPVEFEALLEVRGLRFALAHISWPWCDELLAVYGKFASALGSRPDLGVELFIDTTPGTPKIYREEAFRKVFTIGMDVGSNVIFGTDSRTHGYSGELIKSLIESDNEILSKLGLDEEARNRVFSGNLRRFVGAE